MNLAGNFAAPNQSRQDPDRTPSPGWIETDDEDHRSLLTG